eukprot:jgi/Picre1/29760/NNA_005142.t1
MFSKFRAVGVISPENFGNKSKGVQSRVLPENIQLRQLLGPSSIGLDLQVVGEGYILDSVWLHAGGPEDWLLIVLVGQETMMVKQWLHVMFARHGCILDV